MQLGVNTVLFGGYDLHVAFKYIRWAGYGAVELSAIRGMCEHLVLDAWEQQVPLIRALALENGLEITAIELGPLDEDRALQAFAAAEALGAAAVNVGPGGASGNPGDLAATIERLARLARLAEDHGATLCVKAHVGQSIHDTPTTLEAMAQIDAPGFGIDMDPSHIHRAGEVPHEALHAVVGRVRHVHIRDCKGRGPSPGAPEDQACGRGDIDLAAYVRVLIDAGYTGPVNLEIIGARSYALDRCAMIAAESFGYLNACRAAASRR